MPVKLARFYPIVPDVDWLARIVPLGVKLVQLRIKDGARADIVEQTRRALDITRAHDCQLILNDYWDVALETGADFVHLGQDDLRTPTSRRSGPRVSGLAFRPTMMPSLKPHSRRNRTMWRSARSTKPS